MKKITFSFLACAALLLGACGPTTSDAVKYNDSFVAIEKALVPAYNTFVDQLDGHNIDSLKVAYELFAAKAKSSLEECSKIQPFNEKKDYLEAATNYFKVMSGLAANEAKQVVTIMTKDTSLVSEEDFADVAKYVKKMDAENERINKIAQEAQEAFAKEWKIEIKGE
jgi:hypothetical protein